jgi:hypothetical protein
MMIVIGHNLLAAQRHNLDTIKEPVVGTTIKNLLGYDAVLYNNDDLSMYGEHVPLPICHMLSSHAVSMPNQSVRPSDNMNTQC